MPRASSLYACLVAILLVAPIPIPADRDDRSRTAQVSEAAPESGTLELLLATPQPLRDPTALAARVRGIPVPPRVVSEGPPPPFAVGQVDSFWVLDQRDNAYERREAELRLATPHAYWYVERGQGVGQDELTRSAVQFEQQTYPTVHRHFGTEWSPGIDGDPRITVFVGTVPGVGAYFSSWDEYPSSVYPYSNEREIVLVNTSLRPGTAGFDGTLAHEFQHMVHWHMNAAAETWVDEGSAELASSLAVPGRSVGVGQFQRQPDLQLTTWVGAGASGPHYQAAFLFMQYFAQRYGGGEGLRGLLGEHGRPPDTFNRYLAGAGHGVGFDEVFEDWVVANLLDDPDVDGGRYHHVGSDPRMAPLGSLRPGGPPLDETVHQYGADYVELAGAGADAELHFDGRPTVRLTGADPTSGRKLWWSNRGDGLDATLTRRFDLSDVGRATLRFNLWHDTEQDFDFLYVMASGDGGTSWRVLQGSRASDLNPTGNAVGPGYSGKSGAGSGQSSRPSWVTETVDLTPFAGGEVLVRFEYVTDQAFNLSGALLDDVEIPELGYSDDAEAEGGWVPDGFLRSDNTIPQRWGLRLVEYRRGGEVRVRALAADAEGHLVERLPALGADVERGVLAISGLATRTLEPASYRVSLRPAP